MAERDEQALAVAGVYARALLELAEGSGEADAVEAELLELAGLLETKPEIDAYLTSPVVDEEGRTAAIERAFRGRLSDLVVNTLQVMHDKGRLGLVGALAEAYRLENKAHHGEVDAEVKTAVPLSEPLRERIQIAASRLAGRKARLVEKVAPDLLGGLVLQIGDRKMDGSLARKIHEARAGLFERASEGLRGGKQYFEN